ncbi:hypothetical protein [Sphingobium sp. EM0848]|uniref:hypothetical protein n=1 Tax=Sphingobium sp. EM0848 TaxID=2743473 RepID=UPI002101CD3C|nr:hypothetical protein [Sphingobium sp. EM0848]
MVELQPVEAVLGEGAGLQANLYQALWKACIPIQAFRKVDQAAAATVGRPKASWRNRRS